MSKTFRFGLVALPLLICSFSESMMAQGAAPPDSAQQPAPAPQQPAAPASPQQQPGQPMPQQGAGIPPTMTVAPATPPPPKDPYVLPDGGFYIEPFYWLDSGAPRLRGGLTAPNIADLKFGGKPKPGMGVELGIPAGRSNTLRITAYQLQGESNFGLPKDAVVFGEQYYAGYFLNTSYKTQVIKASWDYLSYTWRKPNTDIRLKTLYEAQYITTHFAMQPPFVPGTSDALGNGNIATGNKSVILPTFGMAIGSSFGNYFRWDVRGSGFGIPSFGRGGARGVIGDVEALVAVRVSKIEVIAGERFLYFKTSPRADMYTNNTLQGVYGGLRFVWAGVTKK